MRMLIALSFLISLSFLSLLAGCQSEQRITADSVRADMSPELETLALTPQQRLNRTARTIDTNLRQFNDDWDALWLLDRPRAMSPMPIPYR